MTSQFNEWLRDFNVSTRETTQACTSLLGLSKIRRQPLTPRAAAYVRVLIACSRIIWIICSRRTIEDSSRQRLYATRDDVPT